MKHIKSKQRGLFVSLLATGAMGLSAPLVAKEWSADHLSDEVTAWLTTESVHQTMSDELTESLYGLGWSEEQAVQPYLLAMQDDLSMKTLLHEAQTQQGFDFAPMDCALTDWQSIKAGEQLITNDLSHHRCLDGLQSNPFDAATGPIAYLVSAEVVAKEASAKPQALVNIESTVSAVDWVSREITSNPVVNIQQEWFTVSNQCASGDCDMGVVLRGLAADAEVKLHLAGIYLNNETDQDLELATKSNGSNFLNQGFDERSKYWTWNRSLSTRGCFYSDSGPTGIAVPQVKFDYFERNNYAFAGNETDDANNRSNYLTSSIGQQISTVPAHAEMKFRYQLTRGGQFNGTRQPVSFRVVAHDINSNSQNTLFSRTANSDDQSWINQTLDMSSLAGKRVNFRFEICSFAQSSTTVGSSVHGSMKLDDVFFEIDEPVEPTGQMSVAGQCQLIGSNTTCTTHLPWQSQNTQQVCVWHADGAVNLLGCSGANQGTAQFHDTSITPTSVVMKNHSTTPNNTLADYMAGTFLDLEMVSALPASDATGILNSTSPCELPVGGNNCTVTLKVQAQNTPINCLWTTSPNMRLVSCSTAMLRNYNWIYANTSGHQFELRGHNSYPQETNADRLSGTFLDDTYVYAVPNQTITPDSYDNVAIRGYDDDSPGDSVVLFAGEAAQFHNFHDAGDEDWTIFALGAGQGVQVNTNPTGSIAAKMVAYMVTGAYNQIGPQRWDITLSDLTQVTSDTSSGNNSVTIVNNSTQLRVYVIKTYGSQHGNGSAYYISSTGL